MDENPKPYFRQPFFLITVGLCGLAIAFVLVLFFTRHKEAVKSPAQKVTLATPIIRPSFVTTGLVMPTNIIAGPSASDKRLYVSEQSGIIRIVAPSGQLESKPFLDISPKVQANGEMGLLGLVFDPNYAKNNYFYLNYIDKDRNTVIARYKASADGVTADPASEKVLLRIPQPYPNHNGGVLAFGPDGYLYAALGDGGDAGDPGDRAQNKNVYFGKILRLDVENGDPYAIPKTNPFAGQTDVKPEIWAYGLRNPWRISFDKTTGDLYIGDVGQSALEEVDFQPVSSKGGENYGWRCMEGKQPYNSAGCLDASHYVPPVLQYTHEEGRCSITGGYVYRGQKYPALTGKYFYADFCSGQIYSASRVGGTWQSTLAAKTPYSIGTFGQDNAGELYFADYTSGSLYRLEDAAN